MPTARSRDGCRLHWIEQGAGPTILLIHGFASTLERNWQGTGWMQALARAGWRAVAYDQRGHGDSEKRYAAEDYAPERLVEDALAILDAAAAPRAVLMGYSMGARVALEVALKSPARVRALILGGIGDRFRDLGGTRGDREIVAAALEADDPSGFPPGAVYYRTFADQTSQDRRALAACWRRPIREIEPVELATLAVPTLVVAGRDDATAGDPRPLAQAIPGAEVVLLDRKNHLNAVGAREHRAAVLRFLERIRGEQIV